MAYTLIGGTAGGTVLILLFLPALYATWYRVKASVAARAATSTGHLPARSAIPDASPAR